MLESCILTTLSSSLRHANFSLPSLTSPSQHIAQPAYERLLIDLDVITEDVGPATYPIVGAGYDELLDRSEFALDGLAAFGVDALSVELLIERLHGCAPGAQPA